MSRGVHRISSPHASEGALPLGLRRRPGSEPPIVEAGNGRRPEVALTFDDGPSSWSSEIASTLESHGCQGTFFVLGPAIDRHPGDLADLFRGGHEIANHLWSHSDAATQTRSEIRAEIRRTAVAIRKVTGHRPRLVRPPYCKAAEAIAAAARWSGVQAIVQRSVGTGDWAASDPAEIWEPLLECVTAGDIIGLHDGVSPDERDTESRQVTAEAVKRIVPGLLERGLRPVAISRLLT